MLDALAVSGIIRGGESATTVDALTSLCINRGGESTGMVDTSDVSGMFL